MFACPHIASFEPGDRYSRKLDEYYVTEGDRNAVVNNFLQSVVTT
jgi:hypothetical protein